MLKDGKGFSKGIIKCGRTDLRRGITGLCSIIRLEFGMDPLEDGTLFLFCGNRRDTIKGVMYEGGDGFILITKKLSNGKYLWPRNKDEARLLSKKRNFPD
jgi:transposase